MITAMVPSVPPSDNEPTSPMKISIFCGALTGASLGFLWYNSYPAEIFMGDVGSLALGAALGIVAILIKQELLLVLVGGVFLLDSIGELASFYDFADLAFVGGSLVPKGGHNVLEAAQFGVPILVGPHTENFRDIVAIFQKAGAISVVTPESLMPTVLRLFNDDAERELLGRRAFEVLQTQQGATERAIAELLHLLPADSVAPPAVVASERRV